MRRSWLGLFVVGALLVTGCAIGDEPGTSADGGARVDGATDGDFSDGGSLFEVDPLDDAPESEADPIDSSGCDAGLSMCGGFCVDTKVNPAHCGGCGKTCSATEACVSSACVTSCGSGKIECGGSCVDTTKDLSNCGACGKTCPSGVNGTATCSSSACGYACTGSYADCDGATTAGCETDTSTSLSNCGGCGKACPSGVNATATCSGGGCGYACSGTFADCDGAATPGCETDTSSSLANCGGCGKACAAGDSCNSGTCVSPVVATTVTFPSNSSSASKGNISSYYWVAGEYVQESFARSAPVKQLDLSFTMTDSTSTYCSGMVTLFWNVKVNGTTVGSYSWPLGTGVGTHTISQTYTFAPISTGGTATLRIEAASTVCGGGGAWKWNVGTATMK
jgi:hypothetical protein